MSPVEARSRLSGVTSLAFVAASESERASGWSGEGQGTVRVIAEGEILLFHEAGHWSNAAGTRMGFTNVFRWSFPAGEEVIRLEHLRFGPANPVYLFDLVPDAEASFVSVSPHLCREDCYAATLRFEPDAIWLEWRVDGPAKKERISYRYA